MQMPGLIKELPKPTPPPPPPTAHSRSAQGRRGICFDMPLSNIALLT